MIRPIHPFPARMAPDLAIAELTRLRRGSVVLDPMAGSGTVLRQASENGHSAIGFDVDPMAVLVSRAWTTSVGDVAVERVYKRVLADVARLGRSSPTLPWIDQDKETADFVRYWFGPKQRVVLRRIAYALAADHDPRDAAALDVIRVALSRIIITKDRGASLGRDVSHSRPHKTMETSTFDVLEAFERSVGRVRKLLKDSPPPGGVRVSQGDARKLHGVRPSSVDLVLTSPPYLNQIDYIRGHRLALVWFGHRCEDLRTIRGTSIGTERGLALSDEPDRVLSVVRAMAPAKGLSSRHASMIIRYAQDLLDVMAEVSRVLRPGGRAVMVVGNSCLRDTFIKNAHGAIRAGSDAGLMLEAKVERRLPVRRRCLPLPSKASAPLGRRMRTESIVTLVKPRNAAGRT